MKKIVTKSINEVDNGAKILLLSDKNISQNNIDKLKLKWKLQTINSSKIKNSWKSNIEINPVYFDNKIIFVSANFQILAVEASSGCIIWKKQSHRLNNRVKSVD